MMRRVSSRWALVLGLVLLAALVGWAPLARLVRAAEFLQRLSSNAATSANNAPPLSTEDLTIAGKNGPIRARLYFPRGAKAGEGIVVAHGVHYRGIDERRLVPFARA